MQAEVVLVGAAGDERVEIDAVDEARAGDLIGAVATRLGVDPGRAVLVVERTGAAVDPEVPLRRAGIQRGDRLRVEVAEPPGVELVVLDGPEPGRRIELLPGTTIVGRLLDHCDVAIGDRSVSRPHCRFVVAEDGSVTVEDLGSANGTRLEGERLDGPTALEDGAALQLGAVEVGVRVRRPRAGVPSTPAGVDEQGRVEFHRAPRPLLAPRQVTVRVPVPPVAPPPRRFPVSAAIIPVLLGVVLFVVTGQVSTLGFALVAPAMLIGTAIEDRRSGRLTYRDRLAEHEAAEGAARQQIDEARAAQRRAMVEAAPPVATLVARALDLDARLWERRPSHADFLRVAVGRGPVPVTGGVTLEGSAPGRRDPLEDLVGAPLDDTPVVIDLTRTRVLGIHGDAASRSALLDALVIRLRVDHGPADVHVTRRLDDRAPVGVTVVLVDGDDPTARRSAAPLLDAVDAGGVAVVWSAPDRRSLPGRCDAVLAVEDGQGELEEHGAVVASGIVLDRAEEGDRRRVEEALDAVVDADATATRRLPDVVTLDEAVGAIDGPAGLGERWRAGLHGLGVVVGWDVDGPVVLDLRRDGPHLLVAGTTGSGKSELLQSLVAGLAARHGPRRLTFLLVDYKGGSAFREARRLPHTVGFVTDLDGHLARRALDALDAELRRRERLVFDAGVSDLVGLEQVDPDQAPPSLVVVIDEFAALVAEVPDFVDGVVDLAQRGRSLGIHLVLATQRPAGIVTDRIRANVNARLCLRVTDPQESLDVVGVPDAAAIPVAHPGRAVLRLGTAPARLLQTPWAGAPVAAGDRAPVVLRAPGEPVAAAAGRSALEVLVEAAVAEAGDSPAPRRPWLPPLPSTLDLASLPASGDPVRPVVGMVDEPRRQAQEPWALDLTRGGAVVYGTARSGQSTFLRTVAVAGARSAPPDRFQVYGIDAGGHGLRPLEVLPHCGAVVDGDDADRVARLLDRLRSEIEARRHRLATEGRADVAELGDAERPPRILVLVDDYAAFAARYERVDLGRNVDQVVRLATDGPVCGVHLVLSAPRRAAVPGSLAGLLPTRVVLHLAEREEMVIAGADAMLARSMTFGPGRGIVDGDRELQAAVLGGVPGPAEIDALRRLAAEVEAAHPARRAPAVPTMPTEVARTALPPADGCRVPVGIAGDAESVAWLDLTDTSVLVAGPQRSGRSTTLLTVAVALRRAGATVHVVAGRRSPLLTAGEWSTVAAEDAAAAALRSLVDALDQRSDASPPTFVVADDADELPADAAAALEELVRRGRDRGVRVVAAAEVRAAHRAFSGPITEVRKAKAGVLLRPDADLDGELFGVRLPRTSSPYPPGRGFLVRDGSVTPVQVAS